MANVNEGHRERLRQRMIKDGLDGFQDHEILELLLFQYLPRKDTNKIAHDLLNQFGTFARVLDASPQQLMMVKGISQTTACNIAMLKEVWQRYRKSAQHKTSLKGVASIVQYAQDLVAECYVEKLVAVYVDNDTDFIFREEFVSDNPRSVAIDIKSIVTTAMRLDAAGVMLFHCHVNGSVVPSDADNAFTEKLFITLANLNLVLLEHIIFNNRNEYYSYYQQGAMSQFAQQYRDGKLKLKI